MDQIDKVDHNTLLQSITFLFIANNKRVVCNNDLTDKDLFDTLKGITKNLPAITV